MSTQKAAVIAQEPHLGNLTTINASVPIPEPSSKEILLKIVAAALNPTDWKHVVYKFGKPGCITGSDAAGVVVKVGSEVKGFKEGDVVSTFVHGNYTETRGAFAQYTTADPNSTINYGVSDFPKVLNADETYPYGPIDSFEGAASITLSLVTIVLSFAGNLNISKEDKGKYILIWGGATSAGTVAIQLAKENFGLKVITTSSSKHFDYLKSLGADHVFDYHDDDVVDQIKQVAGGNIKYALDTVSSEETFNQVYSSTYDSDSVRIDNLLALGEKDITTDDRKGKVTFVYPTLAYVVDGNVPIHIFGATFDLDAETKERYESFWFNEIPKSLKKLKHTNLQVFPKGLESVNPALTLLQEDKISGGKVVFRI